MMIISLDYHPSFQTIDRADIVRDFRLSWLKGRMLRGILRRYRMWEAIAQDEKYGLAGNDRKQCAYEIMPTEPMHRWKVAWEGRTQGCKGLLPLSRSAAYIHIATGRVSGHRTLR
jgi:hypothetical protein